MADPELADRLFLLDGSSLAYRAFFALPEAISTREGFPTNALYGLTQMLIKIVSEYEPAPSSWPGTGARRPSATTSSRSTRPSAPACRICSRSSGRCSRSSWTAFGVPNLVLRGFEADDILGTLAEEAKRQGVRSMLVTGDRDACRWSTTTSGS